MDNSSLILLDTISQELLRGTAQWMGSVSSVIVSTPKESAAADGVVKSIIAKEKALKEDKERAEEPYNKPLQTVRTLYLDVLSGLDNLKRKIKSANDVYRIEEEKKARELQRKLEAEAAEKRRAAEEAARRAREEAESQRRAAEAALRILRESEDAEAQAKATQEAEAAASAAEAAIQQAEQAEEAASTILTPVVMSMAPKASGRGSSMRDDWTAEISNPTEFKAHCVAQLVSAMFTKKDSTRQEIVTAVLSTPEIGFLDVSEKALKAYAKFVKEEQALPGARIIKRRV